MANEDPEGHAMSQLAKLYSEAGKKALAAQYYLKVCICFSGGASVFNRYTETADFIIS